MSTLPAVYRLTYADWRRLPEDGTRYELIAGELLMSPAPSVRHQRISMALAIALNVHLQATGEGIVLAAPTGVYLSDEDVVEPDLLVVLTEHADRLGEQVVEGAPDLVVEILSPGTARRDLVAKRELYARAGIPEYWIVDSEGGSVEVLALQAGAYVRAGLYARADTLRSPLLAALEIPLQEVFPARA